MTVDVLNLSTRCKKAKEPSRELDSYIADFHWREVGPINWIDRSHGWYKDINGIEEFCPKFTSSRDSAVMLVGTVENPFVYSIVRDYGGLHRVRITSSIDDIHTSADGANDALAFCAAALEAVHLLIIFRQKRRN